MKSGVLAIAILYHACVLQAQSLGRDVIGRVQAVDSLDVGGDPSPDASECLEGLCWEPQSFEVQVLANAPIHQFEITFPSPRPCGIESVDNVVCEWYAVTDHDDSNKIVRRRAVVVLHESGSDMTVGRMIAAEIRQRGLHAFLVQMPGYGQRKSDSFTRSDVVKVFAQGLADARRARDAVAALPEVDDKHISLQGTSLGGFVATMTASLDDKYDSLFLLLCGGDLHGVLSQGAKDARKTYQRLKDLGLSEDELKSALYRIEPLRIAHRVDASHCWLYTGSFDTVVPPKHSDMLARKIGLADDHHVRMLSNHYSGIVYLPGIIKKISDVVGSLPEKTE